MQFLRSWINSKEEQDLEPAAEGVRRPDDVDTEDGSDALSILTAPCDNLLDADAARSEYIFRAAPCVADSIAQPPAADRAAAASASPSSSAVAAAASTAPESSTAASKLASDATGAVVVEPLDDATSSASANGSNRTVEIERPEPLLAQAFLSKVAPPSGGRPEGGAPTGLSPEEGFKRFAMDLAPYFIAEYASKGVDVNIVESGRAGELGMRATSPWLAAVAAADGAEPEEAFDFTRFVVPLLQKHRPNLAHCAADEVALVLQPAASALRVACEARARSAAEAVSLMDLLYDDAFVHSLLNWKLQPSGQAHELLRFLVESVAQLHAAGRSYGGLTPQSVLFSVSRGWHLAPPPAADAPQTAATALADREALARLMCFICLPPTRRKEFQPHRFSEISSEQLLRFVEHVPALKILAHALLHHSTDSVLEQALSFYLWHDLPVQAQVINDAKAVIRSMRIGSEEFDRRYNRVLLGGTNWRDALGGAIVPAIIVASRELVNRRDFSPYDFASSASLVRFVANTVGHFEELPLGLEVSRIAFLQVVLAAFPALVCCCYHYLASCPAAHVHNRDSELVFAAIVESADSAHKQIHDALASCSPQPAAPEAESSAAQPPAAALIWDLNCLEQFQEAEPAVDDSMPSTVIQSFAAWKCSHGDACAALAEGTCIYWHDERELRFAQEHLCRAFMEEQCKRSACPNAHGFAEIRAAMNDTSPICWKWLECNCKAPHCRYAHTFRRAHGDRTSRESSRTSNSLDTRYRTPRSSIDFSSGDRPRYARASMDSRGDGEKPRFTRTSADLRRSADLKRAPHAAQNGRRSVDMAAAQGGAPRAPSGSGREAKSFEGHDAEGRPFQSAAATGRSWGRGGPWAKAASPEAAAAGVDGAGAARADDALQQIEEDGWTKAPSKRHNGRSSYSADRPPLAASAAVSGAAV